MLKSSSADIFHLDLKKICTRAVSYQGFRAAVYVLLGLLKEEKAENSKRTVLASIGT